MSNSRWTMAVIGMVLLATQHVLAAADGEKPAPAPAVTRDALGLQVGTYDPNEPAAKTREEASLALRPYPGTSQVRPFYLFAPKAYSRATPPPLVIVLHPRGPLGSFSQRTQFTPEHLAKHVGPTLEDWKKLADEAGFVVIAPLGDPDVLWMGMSWFTGDRGQLLAAQVKAVEQTHAIDSRRVYAVASGEGAHALVATAVRRGDLLAAVAACNPPLLTGTSRRGNTVMPETAEEMVPQAGKRRTPMLILAGEKDKSLGIQTHSVDGVRNDRYQDSSSIPAAEVKKAADVLKESKFDVTFRTVGTGHYAALPKSEVEAVWKWLSAHSISPSPAQTAPAKSAAAAGSEGGDPVAATEEPARDKADPPANRPAATPSGPVMLGVSLDQTRITQVLPKSPADNAGLKEGDVLVKVADQAVNGLADLRRALAGKSPGDSVRLVYRRGDDQKEADVVLAARPQQQGIPALVPTTAPRYYERQGQALDRTQSLKAGLKWLASQQFPNGSFPASSEFGASMQFRVAIASLCGMALMLDEETIPQSEKALAFILSCCQKDGYIYDKTPSFKGMWEHGFAAQFLAESVLRRQRRKEDVSALLPRLRAAVGLIKRAQNIEGGWGYRAIPDPHAEVGPGAAQLDALALARRAGIDVEPRYIQRGLRSQAVLMLPPGKATFQGEWRSDAYEAQAFVLESLLAWKGRPDIKKYLDTIREDTLDDYFRKYTEQTPARGAYWVGGYHTLGLYYTAVAYRRMGKDHREAFAKWHLQVVAMLAKRQDERGAWKGWFGDPYGTAFACLTLGAATDALCTYTASDEAPSPTAATASGARPLTLQGDWQLTVECSMAKSKTSEAPFDVAEMTRRVGLKPGRKTLSRAELAGLMPAEAVSIGGTWTVPGELVGKLLGALHSTARGAMECRLLSRDGGKVVVALSALVKFGPDSAPMVQTTCFEGQMEISESTGVITTLKLNTVSGCTRVVSGGGRFVTLNDLDLAVKSVSPSATTIAPAGGT